MAMRSAAFDISYRPLLCRPIRSPSRRMSSSDRLIGRQAVTDSTSPLGIDARPCLSLPSPTDSHEDDGTDAMNADSDFDL